MSPLLARDGQLLELALVVVDLDQQCLGERLQIRVGAIGDLVFTPDEMIIVIAPLEIVTVFVNFVAAIVAAGFYALRKFKQGGPLTRVLWRAYWLLPSDYLGLKATPPSPPTAGGVRLWKSNAAAISRIV